MSHVYILVENSGASLAPVTAELITAARPLGAVSAVVVDRPGIAESLVEQLAALGAEQIIDASTADYDSRLITPEVDALSALGAANPAPILLAATETGNEIAGRVAVRVSSGVVVNISSIAADRTASQQIFGGAYEVTSVAGGAAPVFTVRPGAVKAAPQAGAGQLAPMPLPAASQRDVRVLGFTPAVAGERPELTAAKTVVAGGRGVGSAEGFSEIVEPLADALGAAVGATRDATDEGWYPVSHQVGQTGVTVSPELYIALGISGAIQHTAGMQTSGTIVVINQDADEPFFSIADLGVVGDAHEIAPALTKEINARKNS